MTRGPYRGDLYITTNHGVTRLQGLVYNSHRHPGWYLSTTNPDGSRDESLQCPPMHGLGIAPNGDVLVANEQMLGVLIPSPKLEEWDREKTWEGPTPWQRVLQLVYEPTVTPSMLLVLTDLGLTVLRGP